MTTAAAASTPVPGAADGAGPLVDALRGDLHGSGYTVDGVGELLGAVASAALDREQTVPARRALARLAPEGDPRVALARLFLLGDEVTRGALDRALPGLGAEGARRLGLVSVAGEGAGDAVRAVVDLRPYAAVDARGEASWWLSSDLSELATGGRLATDHVLGTGGASTTLAQVTTRTPVGRVLDLGTGCGVQALHAARHARAVVGTDLSLRALGFARFNLALNAPSAGRAADSGETAEIELRHGSMLEPVAGEAFDLVVSNPPFVITPHAGAAGRTVADALGDYEYRDGGRSGDDLVRDLVRDVGQVLAPGGVAQLLGNWEHRRGEPWADRVGAWLDEAGLDGWVIQREVLDPAEYAETWIRDGGTTAQREPAAWEAAYGAWLDDFASRDVEGVGFGIVTLRRPVGGARPTLRRLEEHTGSVRQPLGAHVAASLAAHDWLEARDDDALAAAHLVAAEDVTEERFHTPGQADPNVVVIRQGDGLGRGVHASTGLAAFVGVCDGELAVGQIVGALGALLDVPVDDLRAELLPAVRGLVRDGFLRPATAA
ncbi:methyltransferase [Isoptericola sp. 4D.3]|uniref:Methyltransferase n=1 Tax=Isoptericola peretonis TaxID=2918523 RepID=A0ABT0J098_9MICO|nr:methyltransferase [Isoptericola sp. 4D.3]